MIFRFFHISILLIVLLSISSCTKRENEQVGIVERLKNNNLHNIVIPHRINSTKRVSMVHNLGFNAWELDLNFYQDNGDYFKVQHDKNLLPAPLFSEYLTSVAIYPLTKLWLDTRGVNNSNYDFILKRFSYIDSIYHIKDIAIIETSFKSKEFSEFRNRGWHTSYYLPYQDVNQLIADGDTTAQEFYANLLAIQLSAQNVSAISFDVSCYSFVIDFLEKRISNDIVYHCWDLSLNLSHQEFIRQYKEKEYSKNSRIKTVLIPIDY
ncbi:MAG: hypothetical protein KAG64_01425 [Bacteroidales bacterium]|nr:hypothetical protein [Bacteroidales bacterium]